ncbi:MAG: PepSY domain-containing protein [Acidobacteriota bacterium]
MKLFRSVLFWTHLTAGAVTAVVILVMSFTGVVLALKPQIQDWVERDVRYVTPPGSPRLGAHALLTAVKTANPAASPQTLVLASDPGTAATVNLGRDGTVYVDPYTGAVLGTGSAATTRFFQSMTSWHRYMGATGEYRATGRSATGIGNLAFLLLAVTGLYIWWPKQLTLQYLKPILCFRRTSTGRARDFNWHNTIGFWCLIPIVIMTVSGAVISYPWASNLVYRLTGSPVPAGRGGGTAAAAENRGGRGGEQARGGERPRGGDPGRGEGNTRGGAPRGEGAARPDGPREAGGEPREAPAVIPAGLDQIWARAERQVPTWSLLSMRLPNRDDGPVAFTITDGAHWNAFARSNLTLNAASGDVIQWQPYEAGSLGQKARGWMRFAHTGELGGLTGQVIAGLGCLGGVFLVYTGLALALRRLWSWSLWRRLGWSRPRLPGTPATAAAAVSAREAVATRTRSQVGAGG